MFEDDTNRIYEVVRNDEGQYSIWPSDRSLPLGWSTVGFTGVKRDCLAHIKTAWTDLTPNSLRQQISE